MIPRTADPRIAAMLAAAVVHDLRNLLAVAHSSAHLCAGSLDDRAYLEKHLGRLTRQIERAQRLLDRCMAVAKGEPVARESVAFDQVWREVRAMTPDAAAAVDVDASSLGCEISCEPLLLARALANLIENARDASPAGARVELSAAREGAATRVRVRDLGPGLRPEQLERAETSKEHGSGLGLVLVRAVAESHGGALELEPHEGPGAWLCLTLPGPDSG